MLNLSRTELEGLGFCYNSGLPMEGCVGVDICRCELRGCPPDDLEQFRQDVTDDIGEINKARRL